MISVDRADALSLRISRVLQEETAHQLDLYLFVPGELGLGPQVLAEEAFYHAAIHVKRTYYSDRYRLPLVLSRLAERGRLDPAQYRLGMSLYAYQYVVALEGSNQPLLDAARRVRRAEKAAAGKEKGAAGKTTGATGKESAPAANERHRPAGGQAKEREGETEEVSLEARLEEHTELATGILKRLRRQEPAEESLSRYYVTIDNYLSWFTEQRLLALVANLPRGARFREIRKRLLAICREEGAHRETQQYNSERVTRDPTRMSNKMRLLRRLIEYPVTLKQKTQELGGGEQKAVKALATAVVMVFVSLGLLRVRDALSDITALFVLAMAVLYALREVFKDDLRNTLWRLLRRGRPKWRRQYLDPTRNVTVGHQLEWFDYQRFLKLDEEIQRVRKRNVAQREEVVLHYRSRSRMSPTRFLSGYEHTRETLTLDLSPLARLMDKGSHRVYRLEEGQVVREEVEKRHLINLVIREVQGDRPPTLQRWKVVMSRSRIVDVERVHAEGAGQAE
ncbi:hypothetical protein [Halomonas sp. JS92-SW72]|uniref:hypothetical protein n=1 Tax=Halomonas sp. JS92-SW72 TaxID=2306583 RepID=UPI000E5AA843|nr:hypothetical protein [Halomonas sp. JS92-SW72]AXY43060.1 hypothetical protein D1793_13010 [Halomonas sp. JS92-SW72]